MTEPTTENKKRSSLIELTITTLVILGTIVAALRVYTKGGFTYGDSLVPGMAGRPTLVNPLAGLSPQEIVTDLTDILKNFPQP